MKLIYDAKSPFTGNMSVLKEYVDEINDFLLLDMDTGYTTTQNLFNKQRWQDAGLHGEQVEQYINELVQDIAPELREYVKWVDDQMWVLIQVGCCNEDQDCATLIPEVHDGQIKWKVQQQYQQQTTFDLYDEFAEAYDEFNTLSNLLFTKPEQE